MEISTGCSEFLYKEMPNAAVGFSICENSKLRYFFSNLKCFYASRMQMSPNAIISLDLSDRFSCGSNPKKEVNKRQVLEFHAHLIVLLQLRHSY